MIQFVRRKWKLILAAFVLQVSGMAIADGHQIIGVIMGSISTVAILLDGDK